MRLLKEIVAVKDKTTLNKTIDCTTFEDNNGAVELCKASKMKIRINHTAMCYHNFR